MPKLVMKPMPGYIIAVLKKKKLSGDLEVIESKQFSDLIVSAINPEDKENVPFKVGDKIYLHPTTAAVTLDLPEQVNPNLVPIRDIMSYE